MKENIRKKLGLLAEKLSSPAANGYLKQELPCELDSLATSIVTDYIHGSENERSFIRSSFNVDQSFGWLAYAERLASLALKENSKQNILYGLVALVIEGFKLDARENILILSLLNNSATKLGVDPTIIFNEASRIAPPSIASYLHDFSNRILEKKNIETMRYQEKECEKGPLLYVRNW